MTTTPTTDTGPVLDPAEMNDIIDALHAGRLTSDMRVQLTLLLTAFQALDQEPDPEDRGERNVEHAAHWRTARPYWRGFIGAWKSAPLGMAWVSRVLAGYGHEGLIQQVKRLRQAAHDDGRSLGLRDAKDLVEQFRAAT